MLGCTHTTSQARPLPATASSSCCCRAAPRCSPVLGNRSCQPQRHGLTDRHHARKASRRRCSHLVRAAKEEEEEEELDVESEAMERMEKSVANVQERFATVRTGRANPNALDRIMVDYYGAPTPLRQLGNVSAPEANLLVVNVYDKSAMQSVEKAILKSDLGFTPNVDGNIMRINVPQLTQERRKELAKMVSKLGEEGKVAIRNIRRDCMKILDKQEKAQGMSEDEKAALEKSVQELTDDSVKQVDDATKAKSNELLKI